jgi:hypothetical protein
MLINKTQGDSVQHVGLDFLESSIIHGQFYVAVSCVWSVHNIKVMWPNMSERAVTKKIVYNEILID